ncbi:hypothetical protein M758_7G109900 [Ceratodon purpureus]|nr:hypothetical protein M758_7G109900 [Ceratodon purpureus]
MGGVGQHDRARASTAGTKCGDEWMANATAAGACTAPPNPETMTRFPSPRSATTTETTPSPTYHCGHRFQRTNALLLSGDDSPCSEIDCLRARAGSLLSIVPEMGPDQQIIKGEKK